jgi:hypothetical protein
MEAKTDTVMDIRQGMFKFYKKTMEAYYQRTEVYQEERWAKIKTNQEETKASTTIHSVQTRTDHQKSGGGHPGIYQPTGTVLPQGTQSED